MKLNLGCGYDLRPDWINVDRRSFEKSHGEEVDVILDLDEGTWPPEWRTAAEEILLQDVVEHLRFPAKVLFEAQFCLARDGTLAVRGPHYTCRDTHTDPTHRRGLSSEFFERTMNHIGGGGPEIRIEFEWWNRWMHWINWIPCGLKLYEATFLCSLAPAKYVHARITRS